ncbi:MAG: PilZ domain-containing protein [Deltaproteobacteria bacterium]|nr:PilZ domain-containing protein [Deltaproteobacteria bacterium]
MVKHIIHKPVIRLAVLLTGLGSHENRRHRRIKIKWPVVMTTTSGLADGRTHNISLGGAFIRCTEKPVLEDNFRLVMTTKDRLILVNAEVVWSNGHKSEGKSTHHEMGVRFTKLSSNDRTFLSSVISKHT